MQSKLSRLREKLAQARAKSAEDSAALERIKLLLAKADARRLAVPEEARRWNKALENMERSLDVVRARCAHSLALVARLESDLARLEAGGEEAADAGKDALVDVSSDEEWRDPLERLDGFNLEQASQLQARLDAGEIEDPQLEVGLELANQLRSDSPPRPGEREPRRQLVLRAAVEKIKRRDFDAMTFDEIKLVISCHALLTRRLEPTPRDERLRRILDGAIRVLRKKKDEMEGR